MYVRVCARACARKISQKTETNTLGWKQTKTNKKYYNTTYIKIMKLVSSKNKQAESTHKSQRAH